LTIPSQQGGRVWVGVDVTVGVSVSVGVGVTDGVGVTPAQISRDTSSMYMDV